MGPQPLSGARVARSQRCGGSDLSRLFAGTRRRAGDSRAGRTLTVVGGEEHTMPMTTLLTVELVREHDVVLARQRARQLAAEFRLDGQDQTRFATAVSE